MAFYKGNPGGPGRPKGARSLKNMLKADVVCQQEGRHPISELMRLADKAEKEGNLDLASTNWKVIQEYCQAKPKPVDDDANDEIVEGEYDIATLESIADDAN